ncbi:MAG: DegV family protein [Aristaeellaceae bacterium]
MLNCRIVADSSSDLLTLGRVDFSAVPLKVTAADHTWVDDEDVNVEHMLETLRNHKGPSSSACPSPEDWRNAFGEAKYVFCITITSALSGCYNAACLAAREYQEEHPDRRVLVIDSLSTGPEMALLAEKLEELCQHLDSFDDIAREIQAYQKKTHLTFILRSLHNFVNNGRVSPAVGALVGLLGIRLVGVASDAGELQPIAKCRSDRKAIAQIIDVMQQRGFDGGRVLIDQCHSEDNASALREAILAVWPRARITVNSTRALCSYYAEEGGMLVGFASA